VRASYSKRNAVVRAAFDPLEKEFEAELPGVTGRALSLRKQGRMDEAASVLDAFTAACFKQVLKKVDALRRRSCCFCRKLVLEFAPLPSFVAIAKSNRQCTS